MHGIFLNVVQPKERNIISRDRVLVCTNIIARVVPRLAMAIN